MSKLSPWRPGREKHDIAHRAWFMVKGNNKTKPCDKCLRPGNHPIHLKKFRANKDWFGWKRYINA